MLKDTADYANQGFKAVLMLSEEFVGFQIQVQLNNLTYNSY